MLRQGERLKAHARAKGVHLIGDLPFSCLPARRATCGPTLQAAVLLDNQYQYFVAVPPDYFSAQGQLWGNPMYNWDALRRTGYRWCIDRIRALLAHVDVIRLDHFRAFEAAWHIPAGAATAQAGHWLPGPGTEFFSAVQQEVRRCAVHRRGSGADPA